MKIQIVKGKKGKWFWRIVAANGKTLATSEVYSSAGKATKTAAAVAKASGFSVEAIKL